VSISALERSHSTIVEAMVDRMCGRAASAFGKVGPDRCREYAEAGVDALERDLASDQLDAVRAVAYTLIDGLDGEGLGFSDLRFYALTLRAEVRAALDSDPAAADLRVGVEQWFFELLLVCTMRFIAWRDEVMQRESAERSVKRLESQLDELRAAVAEKTHLLEVIRQASTPIAPVVSGILVVPLVGLFDSVRAENLTEKLLQEVSRVHAKTVILDISGVPVFDTGAAQLIIRLARTVRMLGTHVILVGMSPANARTIVALGVDLAGIKTLGTLQDGLAQALVWQQLRIGPIPK